MIKPYEQYLKRKFLELWEIKQKKKYDKRKHKKSPIFTLDNLGIWNFFNRFNSYEFCKHQKTLFFENIVVFVQVYLDKTDLFITILKSINERITLKNQMHVKLNYLTKTIKSMNLNIFLFLRTIKKLTSSFISHTKEKTYRILHTNICTSLYLT